MRGLVLLIALALVTVGCTSGPDPPPPDDGGDGDDGDTGALAGTTTDGDDGGDGGDGGADEDDPTDDEEAEAPPGPDDTGDDAPGPNGSVSVHYLDVGQGDASVWALPGGGVAIYDCGGSSEPVALAALEATLAELGLAPGDTIDLLVVSHGHLDHVRACDELLDRYHVAHLYDAFYNGTDTTQAYQAFRTKALAEGATLHGPWADPEVPSLEVFARGDAIVLPAAAHEAGLTATVLWPGELEDIDWDEIAEVSLVVRLSLGSVDLCFQGDIEDGQEQTIAALTEDLDCEVYLVGHHGSKHASSAVWLTALDPEWAVVSFGDNSFGHPTPEALCRVQAVGAEVYATHRLGDIVVTTDGTNVTVTPDQPEAIDYCATGASYWDGEAPSASEGPPLTVTARADPADPCRFSTVSVHVNVLDANDHPVAGATVETTWHYASSTPSETARTDPDGNATVSRSIGAASTSHTVTIDVRASHGTASGATTTSFTPRACP